MAGFDLIVIGSGPGGYVAAIRAAQLGLRVACVEDQHLGGVCLNIGCIPTKALLTSALLAKEMKEVEKHGIIAKDVTLDLGPAQERSRRVADQMKKGVGHLFKKYKVTHIEGFGRLKGKGKVEVEAPGGNKSTYDAAHVLIATGSRPRDLPTLKIDEKRIWSSTGALMQAKAPGSLFIVGAGAIGMEFADVYASYGTQVRLLEALPRVLPIEDEDASTLITRLFGRRGITVKTGVKVSAVKPGGPGAIVETDGGRFEAEQVLMAVGRAARTDGVGLEGAGVQIERGFVKVSPTMETSAKGIYAIGDMAGAPLLAHKAMAEGVVAAEAIAGQHPRPIDYGNVPSCTYCRPQVASIGASEAKARENGREVLIGKFPFTASGKAVALGETDGFVKVVAGKATGEIVGVHIVGPEATEIIHEFAVGRTLEATVEEIMHTIHAHPTLSEAALEATLAALGQAIHI